MIVAWHEGLGHPPQIAAGRGRPPEPATPGAYHGRPRSAARGIGDSIARRTRIVRAATFARRASWIVPGPGAGRPAGREQIEVGPGQAAAARHYTLSDEDLQNIVVRRRPRNKLGFALQLSRSTSQPSRRRSARAGVQHRLEASVREPATNSAAAAGATYGEFVAGDRRVPPGPVGDRRGRVCVPGARTSDTPGLKTLRGLRAFASGADPAWPA